MLLKNAAQKIHVYAYNSTTGAPVTGDAANITAYVSLDGTQNAVDDTNPTEVNATNLPGIYVFDLTAAETNCDAFALYAKSVTANVRLEPIIGFTTAGTATAIAANAIQLGGTTQTGRDIGASVLLAADQAVNVTKFGGTVVTARDIGASVLLSSGTGAGQISLSSGTVTVGTNNDKTGYTASTVSDKTGYSLVATTGLGNQTADITGNLSGSVGSVTGAVGSVTGAVGSVTGNVGGSVATVTALAANSITASAVQSDAVTEIADGVWAKTLTELSAIPGVTGTVIDALNWIFTTARNKITQNATEQALYKDDGSTKLAESDVTDDATTFTRGEWRTPT